MTSPTIQIRSIDLHHATDAQYAGISALKNANRREYLPDDPPWPCEEDRLRLQVRNPARDTTAWIAVESVAQQIVALAVADIFLTGDNPRLVWFDVSVLPSYRRQGIASRLLACIADHTHSRQRDLLTVECHDRAPGGPAFLERIGASKGLSEPMNQLQLADLDRGLVDQWEHLGDALAPEFDLGLWDRPYPEDQLHNVACLMQEVANDQPRDSLQMEDINYTPELVRGFDDEQLAGGDQRWSLFAVHRLSRKLAGITEVYWNPHRPTILWQGLTGVMPAHRGRGLGRWLKARMLQKVMAERPQVQVIRAGNADSNVPMLKINRQLGFKRAVAWATWQVELPKVMQYLALRA